MEVVPTADAVREGSLQSISAGGVTVGVAAASGTKCERCWFYSSDVNENKFFPGVCNRCVRSLERMDFKVPESAYADEEESIPA